MPDPTAAEYCRFAGSRLLEARDKFQSAVALDYDRCIGAAAKSASLVWDAAVDLLSALALLHNSRVTGVSSDMRQYAKTAYKVIFDAYWRHLARLHNFQHKPNMAENEFRLGLYYTGVMLEIFNTQLPAEMQIAADSLIWLTSTSNQPSPLRRNAR